LLPKPQNPVLIFKLLNRNYEFGPRRSKKISHSFFL